MVESSNEKIMVDTQESKVWVSSGNQAGSDYLKNVELWKYVTQLGSSLLELGANEKNDGGFQNHLPISFDIMISYLEEHCSFPLLLLLQSALLRFRVV